MSEKVESTKFIGEEFKTNNSGICYVVEYTDYDHETIWENKQ